MEVYGATYIWHAGIHTELFKVLVRFKAGR